MSFKVKIPISGWCNFQVLLRIFSLLAINSVSEIFKSFAIFSTIGYASGCTAELSNGFFPF
jgi:hypothetical protein